MALELDCNPCIDRSTFQLIALVPTTVTTTTAPNNNNADATTTTTTLPDSIVQPLQQTARDMNVALEIVPIADANQLKTILQNNNNPPDAWIVTAANDYNNDMVAVLQDYLLENDSKNDDNNGATIPVFGWGWGYQPLASLASGWIATDHVASGVQVADQLLELWRDQRDNNTTSLSSVALIAHGSSNENDDNEAMLSDQQAAQWQAVTETLTNHIDDNNNNPTTRIPPPGRFDVIASNALPNILQDEKCPYQALVVANPVLVPDVLAAVTAAGQSNDQDDDETVGLSPLIGVFLDNDLDTTPYAAVYQAMTRQQVAVATNGALHLQVTLSVLMAALYVTTGKVLAMPIPAATYWSGPALLTAQNVPSDTAAQCEQESFPVCSSGSSTTTTTTTSSSSFEEASLAASVDSTAATTSNCPCTNRRQLRIGGVLHGDISDAFWDPVFAAARQAAADMRVELDLERYQQVNDMTLIYQQMAARILNLCDSGIDGLFVTIPDDTVLAAVQRCHDDLRVPVVSVNSGQAASGRLGLVHHIGQDEYAGGFSGALRLMEAGMKRGYCVDHAFGNTALIQRCQGFQDAIAEQGQGDVTFGKHIDVPSDNQEQYVINVVQAVEADGGWDGVGLLGFGADPFPSLQRVLDEHPAVVAGTFDTSDLISEAIRDGNILFGIDQQPFLQGKMPVYLLSYMVYTQQALTNHVIQSGPSFLEEYPSASQQFCESNFYAVCPDRPEEDFTFIPDSLIALGYALFGLLAVAGAVALAWTYRYRQKWVVKVSQPLFLDLVVLGCLVSGLSIVFMGFQTTYRKDRDESGEFVESDNPEIGVVDASCMTVPWLYGMGFVITFSALFAKIYRVKLIYQAGLQMQRKQVAMADVLPVMGIMFVVEIGILLSWQLVAPLKWIREVTDEIDGYATASVGSCDGGETGWRFYLGLALFHALCLCYALVLCFQTKGINEEFAESSYLSLAVVFMFQVLVLAVPISALVRDNTDVYYFVRAAAVFLQNFTVLVLIFVPKMLRMHEERRSPASRSVRGTSLVRQPTARASDRQIAGEGTTLRPSIRLGFTSWGGASLSEVDYDPSKSVKISNDSLTAIREEQEKTSLGLEEAQPSGPSSMVVEDPMRRSGYNVRFETSDQTTSEHNREARLLLPSEVEASWEELGFPSKEKAQMIIDLVKQSTDPAQRKAISTDLFETFREDQVAPGSGDSPVPQSFQGKVPPTSHSSKPDTVSPRAFSDHLKAKLSDLEADDNCDDGDDTNIQTEDWKGIPDSNGDDLA